jgi:hypothetical protein
MLGMKEKEEKRLTSQIPVKASPADPKTSHLEVPPPPNGLVDWGPQGTLMSWKVLPWTWSPAKSQLASTHRVTACRKPVT